MKIVVLAGGLSTERDVSLTTGRMVNRALKKKGHRTILLDVFLGYGKEGSIGEDVFSDGANEEDLSNDIRDMEPDINKVKEMREDKSDCIFGPNVLNLCKMADMVFMALHGEDGEDGKIQAAFDLFGIKYTGSGHLGSAIAMDKGLSKKIFALEGIPVPGGFVLTKGEKRPEPEERGIHLPCVVKPCCGGSSIGVFIVHTKEEYERAIEAAFSYEESIVVEEYIRGREFSVGVMKYKALPIIEIEPVEGFYDYKNKYQAGSAVETCPANLSEKLTKQMQEYAQKVCRIIKLDTYARMDFLLDGANHIYCLEANTLPGMTPTSLLPQEAQAIGMSFEELCEKIIELSFEKYSQ